MKKLYLLLFLTTLNSVILFSQVQQEWVARYSTPGAFYDNAFKVAADKFGNVYVTGYRSTAGNSYNRDYCTIKYNSLGIQQWLKIYNGTGNNDDFAHDLVVDDSGNVFVTGFTSALPFPNQDDSITTIKYNTNGDVQWIANYKGPRTYLNDGEFIKLDKDGNVIVGGYLTGNGGHWSYITIKFNHDGIKVWDRIYESPYNGTSQPLDLTVDSLCNVYITGGSYYSNSGGPGNAICTIKYDSSGSVKWINRLEGHGIYVGTAIAVDKNLNVYVTGEIEDDTISINVDYVIIKYNSFGIQQWYRTYKSAGGYNITRAIAIDKSQNVIITGFSQQISSGADYTTIKYNPDGDSLWVRTYNGPGNNYDEATAMVLDENDNIYITGMSSNNNGYSDYATVKYDPSGKQLWVMRYDGPAQQTDDAHSIALDKNGNIFVTGWSYGVGSSFDFCTIKYSQVTNVQQISNEIPVKYTLFQNYPNPFNPTTKIKFDVVSGFPLGAYGNDKVVLKVFDILGKEIATLVNESLKPGSYEVTFDARQPGLGSQLPSGVYFYRLTTDNFSDIKKMILLK
jgi:hypothetical protein